MPEKPSSSHDHDAPIVPAPERAAPRLPPPPLLPDLPKSARLVIVPPPIPSRPPLAGGGGDDPADDPRARAGERRQALRRAMYFALSIVAVALSVRAVAGKRGFIEAHRSKQELARLEADVEKWRDRNARIEERIRALRTDPAAIEALARERLGWVRPHETTYLFPYDPATPDAHDPGPVAPGEFTPTIAGEVSQSGDASADSTVR